MKNNKGFVGLGLGLVLAIIAVLVVGGGAYYLGTKNDSVPQNIEENNYQPIENQNSVNLNTTNNSQQNVVNNQNKKNTFNSVTYGYSISYSGIDSKNVFIKDDGKSVNLFPNQLNIDNLEIADSPYTIPNYMLSKETVTFGINQYQKFKDNITPRHTYYLKTGLKNNKSMMIGVKNDSDIPNYLDLSSFKIILDTEESSTETFNNQPGAVKSIIQKGSNWLVEVDLLSYKPDWIPGVNERFVNQNTKIRNLTVASNTKTYNCGEDARPSVLINTQSYMLDMQNYIEREKSGRKNAGYNTEYMTDWALHNFDISGTNITAIYQPCLP